jgi:hypothetical protein
MPGAGINVDPVGACLNLPFYQVLDERSIFAGDRRTYFFASGIDQFSDDFKHGSSTSCYIEKVPAPAI